MSSLYDRLLPPNLLLPMLAVDGKVTIMLEVAVPVPADPSRPVRLGDVLAGAELVDCFAVSGGEPWGGEEDGPPPPRSPSWTTVREWQEKHASEEGGQR